MDRNGIVLAVILAVAGFWLLSKDALMIAGACFAIATGAGLVSHRKFDPKEQVTSDDEQ